MLDALSHAMGEELADGCVLACNYRNRFGEIDIIAKDGDTICFCEVKYRRDNGCGRALKQLVIASRKKSYQLQGIIL